MKSLYKYICIIAVIVLVGLITGCATISPSTNTKNSIDSVQTYGSGFYKSEKINDFILSDGSTYYAHLKPREHNLLLFWADWCPHCTSLIEQMSISPNKNEIADNLVAISEETEDLAEINKLSPKASSIDREWRIFDRHDLEHIPALFVVDGDGKVLGSAEGGEACKELLSKYEANLETN